jgi:ABC-type multidrug transport system fused ATPase/permease subunit
MWSTKKRNRAVGTLMTFGHPHRKWLVSAGVSTLFLAVFRLAMPWPLRGVVESVFPDADAGGSVNAWFAGTENPILWLAGVYVLFAVGCGLCEFVQRVQFMKYSARTVHDLREAAVIGASLRRKDNKAVADLISRIVGDSARLKAGMSGILVHLSHNGLTFVGICGVLSFFSWELALVFLMGGLLAILVGLKYAGPIAENSRRQRRKEGKYAQVIQEKIEHGVVDVDFEEINASSARKEVRNTRLVASSSLWVHVILALTVGVALWIGVSGVRSGALAPGVLFIFMAYSLTMHRRLVQVGRQIARTGKVLACASRLGVLVDKTRVESGVASVSQPSTAPLEKSLRLEQVKVLSARGKEGRARIQRTSLTIQAGSTVAVLGEVGSGKSTLLQVFAGKLFPEKGTIHWDDEEIEEGDVSRDFRCAYLAQEPVISPETVWKIIGLERPELLTPEVEVSLKAIGAWKVIKSFPKGILEKVSSLRLSRNESRLLALAGILLASHEPVWILDDPLEGVSGKRARRRLAEILRCAAGRTVIMALSREVSLGSFDKILEMDRGKIEFDGTTEDWRTGEDEAPLATSEPGFESQERRT